MSDQGNEGPSGQRLAEPRTAKSPQDGSVRVKGPAKVDDEKKRHPRSSPPDPSANWLAFVEKVKRESRDRGEMSQAEVLNKNTEGIRALENRYEELRSAVETLGKRYEELHSAVEALQSARGGRSNCVDQV
ncbi:uncharacterized protein FTJAE_7660 [Fusarium tjaetaba]|uniref:Uncharacterized protein n=1 Tax=Fusarium tjaetaba TaxID=1567544 RepID=A0A8H5RAC1_9HYPO|nr:uncharacterized protein FTJAE_7660 [Fusarium tjaetaba]KAF5632140.1 hypothetical protein FTJAE_7660 [Fusarium tjaetaba]